MDKSSSKLKECASVILGLFWLPAPILLGLLVFLTIGVCTNSLTEQTAIYWYLVPILIGLFLYFVLLKRWLNNAYSYHWLWGALVYLLYSFIALGLGMGVPLLNCFVSLVAGVYIAIKIYYLPVLFSRQKLVVKKAGLYIVNVTMALCALVGFWAIIGGMVNTRFESTFISFTFTIPIILLFVLIGGIIVSAIQYILMSISTSLTLKLLKRLAV